MIEAGERRLRPILMTAIATTAGMFPLALAIGAGSQMLQPLAIAVIGGIIASMVLSLIVTPAVHFYLGATTIPSPCPPTKLHGSGRLSTCRRIGNRPPQSSRVPEPTPDPTAPHD
jgi:hypothetical protein